MRYRTYVLVSLAIMAVATLLFRVPKIDSEQRTQEAVRAAIATPSPTPPERPR